MSLNLEYRPKSFNEVLGNESVKKTLISMVKRKPYKRPHTFLFQGPSGCGKTTLARILAREFKCSPMDLTELDAAKDRNVDAMRQLVQEAQFAPMNGEARVFLIDEVHELTKVAQETLLKTTEDTPLTTYFMLCTTEPEKIIKTIRNRCSTFQVQKLRDDDMFGLLDTILTGEDAHISDTVLDKIVEASEGSPRKALICLDQILAIADSPEKEMLSLIQSINLESEAIDLCRALINGKDWNKVRDVYAALPVRDPEALRRVILGYMKAVILKGGDATPRAVKIISCFRLPYYDAGEPLFVADLYSASQVRRER